MAGWAGGTGGRPGLEALWQPGGDSRRHPLPAACSPTGPARPPTRGACGTHLQPLHELVDAVLARLHHQLALVDALRGADRAGRDGEDAGRSHAGAAVQAAALQQVSAGSARGPPHPCCNPPLRRRSRECRRTCTAPSRTNSSRLSSLSLSPYSAKAALCCGRGRGESRRAGLGQATVRVKHGRHSPPD